LPNSDIIEGILRDRRRGPASGFARLAWLAALIAASPAGAQTPDKPAQKAPPTDLLGASGADAPAEGLYLRDDDEALVKTLREARALAAARRFDEAADKYQAAADACVDQLVPWSVETFQSARQAVKREVLAAPAELRGAMASRFESKAREELESAIRSGVPAALRAVADRHPFTAAGIEAERRWTDLSLERGDDAAAFASSKRLLDVLPASATAERVETRARAALALSRLGDERALGAAEWLASAPEAERSAAVRVRGESRTLENFVQSLPRTSASRSSWAGYLGGNARLGGAGMPKGSSWQLAWSFEHLRPVADVPVDDDVERMFGARDSEGALFPVVHGRHVFAYNARRAVCIDVETGKAVWYRDLDAFGPPARRPRTTFAGAVSDDVFVLIHETGRSNSPQRLLVALSAATGSTLWIRGGPTDGDEVVRSLAFSGAPVLAEGAVLLGAKIVGSNDEVKVYGVGFETDSGATRFVRFLGSGPTTESQDYFTGPTESPTASYAAGRLFVGTGVGIVSAIDPVTGEHLWCYRYERVPFRATGSRTRILAQVDPWMDDPLVASGGRLYTTPVDSGELHVLLQEPDPATGLVSLCRRRKENARYVLGARGGVVFLAGNDVADRVAEVESLHPEGGPEEEAWRPFAIPNLPEERNVRHDDFVARGAVAGDALLVPTKKTVYVVSCASGELLGEVQVPAAGGDATEILRTGNVAVCLEPGQESVFTAWGDRIQRFQRTP
jgi:outer membrane protein assembly factor BamB